MKHPYSMVSNMWFYPQQQNMVSGGCLFFSRGMGLIPRRSCVGDKILSQYISIIIQSH